MDLLEGREKEPIEDNYIIGEEFGLYLKTKVPEYNPTQHPQYGKIRDPKLDKGDFVFALKLPIESDKIERQRLELEAEQKRMADEAVAIAERKQRELEEIDVLIEKKKILLAEVQRLEMEKKTLEENIHLKSKTQTQESKKPTLASIPKKVFEPKVLLRTKPMLLTEKAIVKMLEKYSFFDSERQPFGQFDNDFMVEQEGTIIDRTTGLMWQKGGSNRSLMRRQVNSYVNKLNKEKFAGYSDWRLPTIEELVSLLVYSKINNGLHIYALFDSKQTKCWSADSLPLDKLDSSYFGGSSVSSQFRLDWIVNFSEGYFTYARWMRKGTASYGSWYLKDDYNHVRAVRSVK